MKPSRIACFSDIHIGHARTKSKYILANLTKSIFEDRLLQRIDALFIAGDFFDKILDLSFEYLDETDMFIARLLEECAHHKVMLRVLEGTPSHDMHQNERFETIHKILGERCDFVYVDKLCVRWEEHIGANVLYVPDEWRDKAEDTFTEFKAAMAELSLESVDLAVMHGMFKHQVPNGIPVNDSYHNEPDYMALVEEVIFIGHNHSHSVFGGKIISQGSFDRLAHGEEEPKGYVVVHINAGKDPDIFFVVNKGAQTYKTIELYGLSAEEATERVDKACHGLRQDSRIRLEAEPGSLVFSAVAEFSAKWTGIHFDKLSKDKDSGELSLAVAKNEFLTFKPIEITRQNVLELITARLSSKRGFDAKQLGVVADKIQEFL